MSLASRLLAGGMILMAASACESTPTGPRVIGDEGLKVAIEAGHITLSNETGGTVRYVAMESQFAARALFCLCAGSPTIPPGGNVTLKYSDIAGYDSGRHNTAVIHWGIETSPQQPLIDDAAIKTITAPLL